MPAPLLCQGRSSLLRPTQVPHSTTRCPSASPPCAARHQRSRNGKCRPFAAVAGEQSGAGPSLMSFESEGKRLAPTEVSTSIVLYEGSGSSDPVLEHRRSVMEETRDFLRGDLQRLFNSGEITMERYSDGIIFEDPITRYTDRAGYLLNIQLLRTVFNVQFDLHTIEVQGVDEVVARWTMTMDFRLLPWRPQLVFTGRTIYKVDPDTGLVLQHKDVWDALKDNSFLSLEGVRHVLRQFFAMQLTPQLETPQYSVLYKYKQYEVRRYEPYIVADLPLPAGTGPASGTGFTDLAGYIFGGNTADASMEMTTPVINTFSGGSGGVTTNNMQFPMERKFSLSSLPSPRNQSISCKEEGGVFVAAIRFSGWPTDSEVVQNERALRDALIRDGLRPDSGFQLARYNEPFVPPMLRRNEVLIKLKDFSWPPAGQS